uniref:Uncharacterized protein n=1 Tax=Ditylenchus dipsaci TaxID=166011 RepID=A0A915EMG3_9BILA
MRAKEEKGEQIEEAMIAEEEEELDEIDVLDLQAALEVPSDQPEVEFQQEELVDDAIDCLNKKKSMRRSSAQPLFVASGLEKTPMCCR